MAFFSPLPQRRIIRVSGLDAKPFLHGLHSVDVLKLGVGELRYGLLLSPQGKFLHDMFIVGLENDLLLDVCENQAETLLKRLKLYKLKRDVLMEIAEGWHVGAVFGEPTAAANPLLLRDPRLAALGWRAYSKQMLDAKMFGAKAATPEDYTKHRVSLGVPGSADMIPEKSFAFDFDMDDLHAVNYTKGCYVGQEVTARMHYRGILKKGVYSVETTDGSILQTGTEITVDGKPAGMIASSAGNVAIAMLRHEQVASGVLLAGELAIRATRPAWAKPVANLTEESL